jgi:hypothetical protein
MLISNASVLTPSTTSDDEPMDRSTACFSERARWTPTPTARSFVPKVDVSRKATQNKKRPALQTFDEPWTQSRLETAYINEEETQEELMEVAQEEERVGVENVPARRSLVISGLPRDTALRNVATAIRGGMVLEMYLRLHNSSAHVSFVDPTAAHRFLEHAKSNGVYILGKKVRKPLLFKAGLLTLGRWTSTGIPNRDGSMIRWPTASLAPD